MEITTVNQIIAASSGLIGAIIGASVSSLVNYRIEHSKRDYEAKSFASGFLGEVTSLQMIIRERGYLEAFEEYFQSESIQNGTKRIYYRILIPEDYARFYNSNMNKVGVMGPIKTGKLIRYHQILQAIVQDFKPESYLYINGFDKEALEQGIKLFTMALQLGDELLDG
ncbi:hypothetical protein [Yersinia kristensenii]|uniref:hypothetical protein n=1 Tax=Yersinia kristensenii TaxID=28152 RepID=UPI000C15839E|nr:hypothetical protein [Yersinia kristensenii]MDA5473271.1 hypothetical protein [Yersinia kristensenii]MDA5475617.1 hypothetical protein [Yersinia kristensenii]MDA5507087.1 hypothetical protein [Yersinia kristensenii]MDA5523292.1 hypothetical protein [Yersinia kristensenii]NIK96056.1 hypothetical protein [Yersinia kristensenii]